MNIKLLGAHNCESQNTKLISLLIDDVLALDAGGLTSSLSFPAQQKLKAILLTTIVLRLMFHICRTEGWLFPTSKPLVDNQCGI